MLRFLLPSLFILAFGAPSAFSQSLERAVAAYYRGDYVDAMDLMRPLADEGEDHAQYLIGFMYDRGQGVPEDPETAATWYRRAAELGHPYAQNNLGVFYKNGRGVPRDYVEAYMWFDLAASGYLPAEFGHRERALLNQQDLTQKMSPEEISTARKRAEGFRNETAGAPEYRPPRVR